MRILRLEVENFRGVGSASLDFGASLNVFHGPNELGKSTLAEAVRAALLMPKSRQAESYLRWDGTVPTSVTLTFSVGDSVWRVRKKFSAPFSAVLEQQSGAAGKFREVANGRLVDEKLRDLLRWGISPPGGQGASAKPVSYLVGALLGRQGEVQKILDASLAGDQNEGGRVSITEALGALGSDPRVTEIVDRLTERVDAVFTPTEKLKQQAESPLVKLQEKLRAAEKVLSELRDDDVKGRAIGIAVVSLQDEWLRLSEGLREAEFALEAAQSRHEQNNARRQFQIVIDECRARLEQAEQLSARLEVLRGSVADALAAEHSERAASEAARLALDNLSAEVQKAQEDVVRAQATRNQAGLEDESSRQQRRAVLLEQRAAVEGRLRNADLAAVGAARLATAESDLSEAAKSVEATRADVERATAELEYSKWLAERVDLAERDATARHLLTTSEHMRRREETAAADLKQTEADLASAESYRRSQGWSAHPATTAISGELDRLLAADARLRIDDLRETIDAITAHDARRKSSLESASLKRDEASRLEQQIATSLLPTEEQIAVWREWEAEQTAAPTAAEGSLSTAAMASLAGFGVGAVVAAVAMLTTADSTAAVGAGVGTALLAGALVWHRAKARDRLTAINIERRRLREERLAREVRPALRRAGLSSLAEFEGARGALDRMRSDTSRLRVEAGQDDQEAATAGALAAPLEGLRHQLAELTKQDVPPSLDDITSLLNDCGRDAAKVRGRIDDCKAQLDALTTKGSQDAAAAVAVAQELAEQKKGLHAQAVKDAAAATAQYEVALQQCRPDRASQLQALIEASRMAAEAPTSVESAAAALDRAKGVAHQASARTDELRRQVDSLRPTVEHQLATLGEDPTSVVRKAQAELVEIDTQLAAVTRPSRDVGADADGSWNAAVQRRDDLNVQLPGATAKVRESAAKASAAAETTAILGRQVASAEGELKAIDRADLEVRLQKASHDPVFNEPDSNGPDLVTASKLQELAKAKLHDCEGRLNVAKGQLHSVGGHVVADRLVRQEEVVAFARQEYEEKELTERAALRLLKEIKAAEAEATSHLGRTLAGPVTEMLRELTGGRYGSVGFSTDLTAGDVVVDGTPRDLLDLSVGTREQLATLVRLAIAAQLQTCLVLDDQLVHSDTQRLAWFRDRLGASARDREHQVIVFTCRPSDYLAAEQGDVGYPVNVVDLTSVVEEHAGVDQGAL